MKVLAMYLGMLVFDLSVIAGTANYVDKGWSAWWFVLALAICAGSNPGFILEYSKK